MNTLRKLLLAAAAATTLASCYYDAYGSGYSSSGSYGFSGGTTFIHTSSDRWFYDPSVRCYYDRHRSCYYDPFLGGYYPSGYCPRPIYNAPHPYGWNGHGTCPVPRNVTYVNLDRGHDRLALLRARNLTWAQQATVRHDSSVDRWQQGRFQAASGYRPDQHQHQTQGGGRPGGWGQQQTPPQGGSWQNRPDHAQNPGHGWGNQPQGSGRPGYDRPVTHGGGHTPQPPAIQPRPTPPPMQQPPPAPPANNPPLNQRQQRLRDFANQFQ